MNQNRHDWTSLRNQCGSAAPRKGAATRHNKTEHDAKEREGEAFTALNIHRRKLLASNRTTTGNPSQTAQPNFSSFSKLSRGLLLETSSICRISAIHSESTRNAYRQLSKKGRTVSPSSSGRKINSRQSLENLSCESNDTISFVMGNVKNISAITEKHKEIKPPGDSQFSCVQRQALNISENEVGANNEDLCESWKAKNSNESCSSSLEEIPSISSKESSHCSNSGVSSQDSAFVSNCQQSSSSDSSRRSWTSPIVADSPCKNSWDNNSRINHDQSSIVTSASTDSTSHSNWAKVKLCLPSRKPQITGIAVQQHPRSQQPNFFSKGKRRILQKERERENAVVLESKKLVVDDPKDLSRLWIAFPFVYKINDGSSSGSGLLQQVCKERGWRECREKENIQQSSSSVLSQQAAEDEGVGKVVGSQSWNLWWRTTTMTPERSSFLKSWQLTNHIPKISTNFSRKDNLARILTRMRSNHAIEYDFSPRSFILPQEYYRLLTVQRNRFSYIYNNSGGSGNSEDSPGASFGNGHCTTREKSAIVWICKPVCKSQGKGIVVFDRVTEFSYDLPSVVQEYIKRPYLINGYKWDLRLYVCITSTNPLTIYAYRGGITRFATHKYDLNDLLNQYSHLTNTYINKQSSEYKKHKEGIGLETIDEGKVAFLLRKMNNAHVVA